MTSKEEIKETIKNYKGKRVPTTLSINETLKKDLKFLCLQNDIDMSDVVEYTIVKLKEQENK